MALTYEKGTFTKTTSTSTPVSQTINLVNSAIVPKLFICWTNGLTTTDGTYADHAVWSYGFSDGTNDCCQSMSARDGNTTQSESYSYNNDCVTVLASPGTAGGTTPSMISKAVVSSFGTGVVNLSWTTQTDTNAVVYHYIVAGGDDITNVSVFDAAIGDTSTGNHSFNGSGTSFIPNFMLTFPSSNGYINTSGINTFSVGIDHAKIGFGAAISTTQRFFVQGRTESVGTADTDMYHSGTLCLADMDIGSGAIWMSADFVSFNDAAGGGITLDFTDAAVNSTDRAAFLLVKGGAWDCGVFQQRSGTGTQDVTLSNANLTTNVIQLIGINSATTGGTTPAANNYISIGATDGTRQGNAYCGDQNAATTMIAARSNQTSQLYRQATPAATATSSTTNAQCTISSMATAGQFSLSWGTADTTLRRMAYWTVGTAVGQYNRSPSVDSTTVSEVSLVRTLSLSRAIGGAATTANLEWTANPGGENIDHYNVYRSTTQNFVVDPGTTTPRASPTTNSYEDSIDGQTYYYKIAAVDTSGKYGEVSQERTAGQGASTGDPRYSISFSQASSQYVDATDTSNLKVGETANSEISYSIWLKWSSLPDPPDVAIRRGSGCISIYNATWNMTTDITYDTLTTDFQNFGASSANVWHHFVVVHSDVSDKTYVYKDNVELWNLDRNDFMADTGTTGSRLLIGAGSTGASTQGEYWTGLIDNPRVYNVALTAGEVQTLYNKGNVTRGLVADWRFDEGSGTTANDSSGNNNTATLKPAGTPPTYSTDIPLPSQVVGLTVTQAGGGEVVTISEASLTAARIKSGVPSVDSTTITESSLTRLLSSGRSPSSDTTIIDEILTANTQAARTPNTDTVTVADSSLVGIRTLPRLPASDDTTVSDVSVTRLLSSNRTPSPDTTDLSESLERIETFDRIPSQDTVILTEDVEALKTVAGISYERAPATDTTTVSDVSIVPMLSYARTSEDTITISEADLTRILSSTRAPTPDSSSINEQLAGSILLGRAPSTDSITISEAGLTRLASLSRVPSSDVISVSDSALTAQKSLTRHAGAPAFTIQIPFYIYPFVWIQNNEWQQLADFMAQYPQILFIVKINPDSGPGASQNQDFVDGLDILKAQGNSSHLKILGYVYTDWGARPIQDVKDDIDAYNTFYPGDIDGIILDEMESVAGDESYYAEITAYIHQQGYTISWGNPGTAIAESYVSANVCDVFEICESADYPTSQTISDRTFNGAYPSTMFAVTVHSAPSYNAALTTDFARKAEYIFVTSDEEPNPYDTISTYLDDIAEQVVERVTISELVEALLTTPGQFNRSVSDTTTISEASLTRILSNIRTPTPDTLNVSEEVSGGKLLERIPSADTTTVSDATLVRALSLSRTLTPDTVEISEEPVTRLLQAFRLPAEDTVTIGESLSGGRVFPRTVSTDTTTISEQSLVRILSVARTIQDSVSVVEALLQRMLSQARTLEETITISELAAIITHIRMLEETISVSDVSLNALATYIRAPEIDSTSVSESIFYTGGTPTDLVSYALPDEVRPLLGNLGTQRTDDQINRAVEAATDLINRRTNRIPPNNWKNTDTDWDLIKKLARYIAVEEMAIGIKDFDTTKIHEEIDYMFEMLTSSGAAGEDADIVESNADTTYALNPSGIIWSTRYKNLKKESTGEGNTTINTDT